MSGKSLEFEASQSMLVAQLGARMHYAVPRIFQEVGRLGALHTDTCAVKGWPAALARLVPPPMRFGAIRRLLARVPRGIPPNKIRTENDLGIRLSLQLQRCRNQTEHDATMLSVASEFSRRVVQRGLDGFDGVYTFNFEAEEILQEARNRGMVSFVEQAIASREIVVTEYEKERELFPDLVGEEIINPDWRRMADREQREWELADVVVCGSQFVLDSIRAVGGPVEKAVVVNYGVDIPQGNPRTGCKEDRPVHILFVGEVGFRKGSHYLIEAARRMGPDYHFRFCGRVKLSPRVTSNLPPNVELLGTVPRSEMPSQYQWADIFSLPSLVEGSATVTYEAMAMGLPIVTTPNAGSLVRDGIDGSVVPCRDMDALVQALERCAHEGLSKDWQPPRDRVGGPPAYTLDAYKERMLRLVDGKQPIQNAVTVP